MDTVLGGKLIAQRDVEHGGLELPDFLEQFLQALGVLDQR